MEERDGVGVEKRRSRGGGEEWRIKEERWGRGGEKRRSDDWRRGGVGEEK